MRAFIVGLVVAYMMVVSECTSAEKDRQIHATQSATQSVGDTTESSSAVAAWKTNMTVFVEQLYECLRRCSPTPANAFDVPDPTTATLTVDAGGEMYRYGTFNGDSPICGKTPQGEINRFIGDGVFDWIGIVLAIKDDGQSLGKKRVVVALPQTDPPEPAFRWDRKWAQEKSIELFVGAAEIQRLGIREGSVIQFTGNVRKKTTQRGDLSGVTALHALTGDMFNMLNIRVDRETTRVICVLNQKDEQAK